MWIWFEMKLSNSRSLYLVLQAENCYRAMKLVAEWLHGDAPDAGKVSMQWILIMPVMLVTCFLNTRAASEPGPHAVVNVSQELLQAYKGNDAAAFRQLLAPSVQGQYPVETLYY